MPTFADVMGWTSRPVDLSRMEENSPRGWLGRRSDEDVLPRGWFDDRDPSDREERETP